MNCGLFSFTTPRGYLFATLGQFAPRPLLAGTHILDSRQFLKLREGREAMICWITLVGMLLLFCLGLAYGYFAFCALSLRVNKLQDQLKDIQLALARKTASLYKI